MPSIRKKNLIIIMSDQHSKHMLGSYGNTAVKTPNLDSLAQNGVTFENAYCNSPLCVPSRSSMVTGQYSHKHGYWDNAHGYAGGEDSFGTVLQSHNVRNVMIGKMHLQNDSPSTGFHDQRITLHMVNGEGDIYGLIRNKEISRPQFKRTLESAGPGETDYTQYDRAIAQRAQKFLLEEVSSGDEPFVLYLGFVSPHFPLIVPQKYFDMYADQEFAPPVQGTPEEWPQHPVLNDYRRYCDMDDVPKEVAQRALAAYYGLCTFLDDQVGVVLDALKESGLQEETRIIYTSDHGDTMGEHGLYYKSTMYEGSVGVPMIISDSDLPQNVKVDSLVSLVDIFPTVLHAVGLKAAFNPSEYPGNSLFDVITDPLLQNRPIFAEYHAFGSYTSQFMLRWGSYKYIHYVDEPCQLFDLKNDPQEVVNLATNPTYQQLLEQMQKKLEAIVDPEVVAKQAMSDQHTLLEQYGGEEGFLKSFTPLVFSPIPKGV